jgi:1,4-alpha-glucan branching enzyme
MAEEFNLMDDPILARVWEELRLPVAPLAGVDRALARIARERRRQFWTSAAAAVLMAAVGGTFLLSRGATRPVHFAVRAPNSNRVALVGDFNDWNRNAVLLRRSDGEWSVTLRLRPGRYRYSYLADGARWIGNLPGPAAGDDFDTPTAVVTVAK